jgi:Mg-chelatase subunit ChlD
MTAPFGLGTLNVETPAVLFLLLALPLLFFRLATSRRARLAAACRALAAGLLVLALAGLRLVRPAPASGSCVVAAIDVSASVAGAAVASARAFLARLERALGPDDLLGTFVFAGNTRLIRRPAAPAYGREELTRLPGADALEELEAGDTDLAGALARATPLCGEDKQAAILLFTDGNETRGSVLAEARLIEPRTPVFPILPPAGELPPAVIRRVLAPTLAPASTLLPLQVVVDHRAPGRLSAALAVRADGRDMMPVPLDLPAGPSVITLPYRLNAPGHHLLEAELLMAPGVPAAGPVATAVTVTRPVHALLVSDRTAPVIATALAERGVEVEAVAPDQLAGRIDRLGEHHVVILDDTSRAELGSGTVEGLARWVASGGALIVTGGPHLFGDAALATSPLARVLPVTLQSQAPEPEEREPIALYLLIDRSNSMGYSTGELPFGAKMEYAKRAALAVLEQLSPSDLVGAIAFDAYPYELGPLASVAQSRDALTDRIERLQYGGGTDFKDALERAARSLLASDRRVRHIILLTDGDTNRRADDHSELIARLARDGITVTTIRIGNDTGNLELLETISRTTGGEFHHVENPAALPQLMIRDTQRALDVAANRLGARARISEPGPILAGIKDEELPHVARWAMTRVRAGAEVRLYAETLAGRDPLLVTWQYELGRVAALPMDFQAEAAGWAAWRGFGKLWTQLVLWAVPHGLHADRHLEARREAGGTVIRLTTIADEPGPYLLRLPRVGDVPLRPIGRRTFTAIVPDLRPGPYPASLRTGEGDAAIEEPVDLVVPRGAGSEREHRAAAPDLALLTRLGTLTGGQVGPEPRDVLVARPGVAHRIVPLDLVLVPAILALLLTDIALRRWI